MSKLIVSVLHKALLLHWQVVPWWHLKDRGSYKTYKRTETSFLWKQNSAKHSLLHATLFFSLKKPKACYETVRVQVFLRLFFAPYGGDLSPFPQLTTTVVDTRCRRIFKSLVQQVSNGWRTSVARSSHHTGNIPRNPWTRIQYCSYTSTLFWWKRGTTCTDTNRIVKFLLEDS